MRPERRDDVRAIASFLGGLALAAVATCACAEATPTRMFDGRSLAGWEGTAGRWRVEDGAITAEIQAGETLGQNEFLWWADEVADFELELEYRIAGGPTANSGIQYRSQRQPDGQAVGCQADLDDGTTWLGRIYDEHGRGLLVERGQRVAIAPDGRRWSDTFDSPEAIRSVVKPNAWNRYRIRATNSHVTIWINDTLAAVLDDRDTTHAESSGRIALQLHSGAGPVKLQFRDLRLTDLGGSDSRPEPAATATSLPPPGGRAATSPVLWHLGPNAARNATGGRLADTAPAFASLADMRVMPGFRCDLVAAEPDIRQPIAFTIDPRGRLWVVEAHCYPQRRKDGEGLDRIVILADADGDGSFETRTVFTEGLNLVSGIEVGFGGVWVGAAPHLLFIPDRDGDDVPDGPPEVLLDGWGYGDTHETLNSFTWGPDGWLYGNHGVFTDSNVGVPGSSAARQRIRAGVWRYHPCRKEFEIFAHGGSNQWGIDFTSVGDAFMTHCRSFFGGGGTSHVIRNGHFWNQVNTGYAPFICREPATFAAGLKNFLPAAARYDSGEGGAGKPGTDAVYGGHSHVGTMIYLGDNWPAIYRDRLFTLNLHGAQINHQEIVRQGSGYEVFHAGYDMAFSPDPRYLAVDLQYGPDGSVFIIDWCDKQHCHTSAESAWDRSNGRVYRLAWAESFQPLVVNLTAKSDAELVALHGHRNEWFVRTARRLLQERAAAGRLDIAAVKPLATAVSSADPVTALRALWTLHVTDALDDASLAGALRHPSENVRSWAVRLATERPGSPRIAVDALVAAAGGDPSGLVRQALASALPALPAADRWEVAERLAMRAEDARDRFLPKLMWSGIASDADGDPQRLLALAAATPLGDLADSIRWYLARSPVGRNLLAAEIRTAPEAVAGRTLRLLDFSLSGGGRIDAPEGWDAARQRFTDREHAEVARRLAAVFGDEDELARLRATLADRSAAETDRAAAVDLLGRLGDPQAVPLFVGLLDDPAVFSRVLPLVSRSNDPQVANRLLTALPSLAGQDRDRAVAALASKPAFARPFVEAIAAKRFPKDDINPVLLRQLRGLSDPEITTVLDAVYGKVNESSAASRETMARLKKTWRDTPKWAVDASAGRAVFERACAACHTHGDSGGKLGPNLTGAASSGIDYFIDNLVDPNLVVGPEYELTTVVTDDGRVINGIVADETDGVVVLRTPDGSVTVPKETIEDRKRSPVSLMPKGILESLPESDMLALLKFLTTP